MFKINLKKNTELFESLNKDKYESKEVTGRIHKECCICKKHINPRDRSVTNTRIERIATKKYITYHTCIGACTTKFQMQKFKL